MTDRTAGAGARAEAPDLAALVAETTEKSAVVWLRWAPPGGGNDPAEAAVAARPRLAWHVWHDGAVHVVHGGAEQQLDGLDTATEVAVTVRSKDDGSRVLTWVAQARALRSGSPEWQAAAAALAAARLNGRTEDRLLLWAADSTITRLTPTDRVLEHPGQRPHGDHVAPPPPSPATTRGPLPWVLHRRPRRAPPL